MDDSNINKDIWYAVDLKGVAVLNKIRNNNLFIEYPEAAVWLIFVEGHKKKKSQQMLEAILGKNKAETKVYINECISSWKNAGIIN